MNPWEKNNWYDFDSGDKPSSSSADNRSDNQKHGSDVSDNDKRNQNVLAELLSRYNNLSSIQKSAPTVQALIGLASKWGENPWEVDLKSKTQTQCAFIIHATKTNILNGKVVDGEKGDFILYEVKCETQIGGNSEYMDRSFYMFEKKSKQEGAELNFYGGSGDKNLSPNALKPSITYNLEWKKMTRGWANGKNSIYIQPGYVGHSNKTFIHPAYDIEDLGGCKGLCFADDLGIDSNGRLKVLKNGFFTSKDSFYPIYNKYFELQKKGCNNIKFILVVKENHIYYESTPFSPKFPTIIEK